MEPEYAALADKMAGSHVRVAKYQADTDREFASASLGLKTFPSIVYYPKVGRGARGARCVALRAHTPPRRGAARVSVVRGASRLCPQRLHPALACVRCTAPRVPWVHVSLRGARVRASCCRVIAPPLPPPLVSGLRPPPPPPPWAHHTPALVLARHAGPLRLHQVPLGAARCRDAADVAAHGGGLRVSHPRGATHAAAAAPGCCAWGRHHDGARKL